MAFLSGACDLSAFRRDIARDICINLETAEVIERTLNAARDLGKLKRNEHRILIADIRRITTEEVQTDPPARVSTHAPIAMQETPEAPPLPELEPGLGSVLNHRYQLEELVSDGPMGKVFRASDLLKQQAGTNAAVAIKMLSPDLRTDADALARLQQEAFQVQRLNHPHIINVFDYDRAGETDFIAMEWLEGATLASLLDRTCPHPLDMDEVQRITAATVAGLSYAHALGIVHGDVKPANIYLCRDQSVKIIDFGTVRSRAVRSANVTGAAYAITPGYASCELLEGNEPCPQDDVYALACTIYRMLAGYRPFGRLTSLQAESTDHQPRQPDATTPEQWRILRQGMEFRRENRLLDVDSLLNIFRKDAPPERRSGRLVPATLALLVGLIIGAAAPFAIDWLQLNLGMRDAARFVTGLLPDYASERPTPNIRLGRGDEADALPPVAAEVTAEPSIYEPDEPLDEPLEEPVAAVPADVVEPIVTDQAMDMVETETETPPLAEPAPPTAAPVIAEPAPKPRIEAPAIIGPTGFASQRLEVSEGDGFVRLVISAPGNLDAILPVRLVVTDGSAKEGEDFVTPPLHELEFGPGNTTEIVFIPLIGDAIGEHIEEFGIRLEGVGQDLPLDNTAMLVIVVDDDQPESASLTPEADRRP